MMHEQGPQTEIVRFDNSYYVLASSTLADDRTRVLKQGETFAVFNRHGDVQASGLREQGLYHEGTRHLSIEELRMGEARPLLLSSTVREDNAMLAVDLMNPDLRLKDGTIIPRGTLHIFRSKLLWDGTCHERLRVSNYGAQRATFDLLFRFEADYADIFEVRGRQRPERGRLLEPKVTDDQVVLAYEGLDKQVRTTTIRAKPAPARINGQALTFNLELDPHETAELYLTTSCTDAPVTTYAEAAQRMQVSIGRAFARACQIRASQAQFDDWLNRSLADLHLLVTHTPSGPYPYAGTPWFSCPFGRDGIITALQTLWVDPDIARGVLSYLAATQAREVQEARDAEPGKILHEARRGEMAALQEVPFGRYYGSVDGTPLFVVLAGHYLERTGDLQLVEDLWPNVEAALGWIDKYGDIDGDGFVEYSRNAPDGLVNQGWKDSHDSVFHADGRMPEAPVALAEVQGYVYDAKRQAARMARLLEREADADRLEHEAEKLRLQFERAYWMEDLSTYAIALDGEKRPCRIRASNAGHLLWSGIVRPERAERVARTLLSPEGASGFGIRTLATGEARYNPMSYHNGSIWPHDNAIIAAGFARYGLKQEAMTVLTSLFDAALFADLHRLPELYCGFERRPGQGPTFYPTACAPQAWAAGAPFMVLGACLGLRIQAPDKRVTFDRPVLPAHLEQLALRHLRVGREGVVDLELHRHEDDVALNVLRRDPRVEVVVVK